MLRAYLGAVRAYVTVGHGAYLECHVPSVSTSGSEVLPLHDPSACLTGKVNSNVLIPRSSFAFEMNSVFETSS